MSVADAKGERTAPRIESDDLSLEELFKDFYAVPDFQREYVWESEHVEKLLTDILDEFYDDESRLTGDSEYFIGSIVACADDSGAYQLIDGQQRLTTIFLAVCTIRDLLVELHEPPTVALQNFIKAVSMDKRTMADIPRYRLALQYEDSHGVLETIAEARQPVHEIPQTTESMRHIVTAYNTIREFVTVNFSNDPKRIKEFLASFMFRVKLIRIVTPNLAHALKVFETINDRGVGLNAMDLLKNLLFMRTRPGDYHSLKDRWKELINTIDRAGEKPLRFLRYYIMSHHDIDWHRGLREDEIYAWFVENEKDCGINSQPLAFVDRLIACARAYGNFLSGRDVAGTPAPYVANISMLAGAAVRQHLILLLAGRELLPVLFTEVSRQIENLFFCYLITREPTKTFERNFARWSKDLRGVTDEQALHAFLEKYFKPDMAGRAKAFDFNLGTLTQWDIQQYRLRYILAKLAQHVDQQAWDNPAYATLSRYMDRSVHIEHILSQGATAEARAAFDKPDQYFAYTPRLGNMTLLERTINTSVSNAPYEVKKAGYKESKFLLTSSLVEKPKVGVNTQLNRAVEDLPQFEKWDSAAIEQRQQMLVKLAHKVWLSSLEEESD